jgi:methylphosphotriester-DNA--protein-cysteine methyltransferase
MVIDTASQAAVLGISFKPGGAFPFLKMPASELHDLHVPLDTLWKADGANLRARLLEAPTPEAKFRIVERCLLAQAKLPLARHPAVAFALQELQREIPSRSIADVTAQIGLSPRRFIQVFHEEVGLTPKLYCRIQRFQAVLRHISAGKRLLWADIAVSCGYFDQAHFVHDFRAFSGITPTAYTAIQKPYTNHVPLAD